MRWMIWPRQYGKTDRVKQWWLDNPCDRVIVTADEQLARHYRRDLMPQLAERYYEDRWTYSFLKTRVMSWRSWQTFRDSHYGQQFFQVALDDCVKAILRDFVGREHELVIISDCGRSEELPAEIVSRADKFHAEMHAKYGIDSSVDEE